MNDDTWARMMTLGITLNNNRKNSLASKLSFKYVLVRFYIYYAIFKTGYYSSLMLPPWSTCTIRYDYAEVCNHGCAPAGDPEYYDMSVYTTERFYRAMLRWPPRRSGRDVFLYLFPMQEVAEKAEWASKLRAAWSMCFDSRLSFLSNSFSPDESRTLLNNIKWWICAARVRSMRHICKSRHSILPVCV